MHIIKMAGASLLLLLFLAGCSVAPQVISMIPEESLTPARDNPKRIFIDFSKGGRESDLMTGSHISAETLYGAMFATFGRTRAFKRAESVRG